MKLSEGCICGLFERNHSTLFTGRKKNTVRMRQISEQRSSSQFMAPVRFDEYFRAAVTSSAGPFVALGNPEDYIPPEGASRLYAKDSDWKERLDALARRALWIVVEIGSSDHLSWEFEHLPREGLQQKLFIITPPAREASRFVWWFIDFNRYINGIGAVSWLQFSEGLASLGYEVDRTDPGPGAVVTFDGNAKSVLLIRDAKTPEE